MGQKTMASSKHTALHAFILFCKKKFNYNRNVYLRNKFHFSEVHRSMNAMGHVQSKLPPEGTRCVHASMRLRKMKIISFFVFTLCFYIVFCSLFVKF